MKPSHRLAVAAAALFAGSTTFAAARPAAIDLPGDALHPESVSIASDGTAYVGSPRGGVLRVSLRTGKVDQWIAPAAFGSGSMYGMFIDERRKWLWTCTVDFRKRGVGVTVPGADPGSLAKAFDLRTGKGVVSLPLPGNNPICNDFAIGKDGSVYITDTTNPNILRWREGATSLDVWVRDEMFEAQGTGGGLDGLAFAADGNLYVNNVRNNALYRIAVRPDGSAGAVTRLTPSRPLSGPDGMRAIGGMRMVVVEGPQDGRIALLSIDGDRVEVTTLADGILSPTGLDTWRGQAWYVQGQLRYLFSGGKEGPPLALPFRLTPVAIPR